MDGGYASLYRQTARKRRNETDVVAMRVLVLGGGVIGTSSAYYLARAGHEVTVIDRQPGPGLETSFANAGQVSPGYSAPWAGPGLPLKAIKWLFMRHRPLVIWPQMNPAFWRWGLAMLRNCTAARYERNKSHMVGIAEYSRDCLRNLRRDAGITYDDRALGTLQVFRTQAQLDDIASDIAILQRYQVPYEVLDRAGCIAREPGLAQVANKIVGGLRLPGDETGDCFKFTQAIAALATQAGVQFRYGISIQALLRDGSKIAGIQTSSGVLTADAYVLALGSYSPLLLRPIGIRLPVYPVKGYSLTASILDADKAPVSTIMDETYKVALTRLGDRIRVGGTAELAGYNLKLRVPRRQTLEHVVTDLFPGGGDVAGASFWCGLRPMTPHGAPIIGRTGYANLLLNTGHGTLGWTMAAGSGRVLADLVSGRKAEIPLTGLTLPGLEAA
ncbi:D-amino acid dehydrogenase [Dongia soli]|uniref:D-amino acid dehydrogenase n=1 Tax=Dongia soli TaxID=600628 RepID=UPI0036157625